MKALAVFLVLGLILNSCNDKKQDSSPKIITHISQDFISNEAATTQALTAAGIQYQESRRSFGNQNLSPACDATQIAAIKDAESIMTSMEVKLAPHADIYREGALDFYRRVVDKKKNLVEISTRLKSYCELDHKTVSDCIGGKTPVALHINKNVSGYLIVHPVIIPNEAKGVGLYLTEKDVGDENYVRSLDVRTSENLQHYAKILPTLATVEQLEKLFECISAVDQKSEVGQQIRTTARISMQLARNECLLLKARRDLEKKKEIEDNISIVTPISAEQAWSCGKLLE